MAARTPASILEEWLEYDPSLQHQVRNLKPGKDFQFFYSENRAIERAWMTHDEVKAILAKLVLQGKIK